MAAARNEGQRRRCVTPAFTEQTKHFARARASLAAKRLEIISVLPAASCPERAEPRGCPEARMHLMDLATSDGDRDFATLRRTCAVRMGASR
jgi:hypothetical protein